MARRPRKRSPHAKTELVTPDTSSVCLHVSRRQLATMLAALRFHQDENLQGTREIPDKHIHHIATRGGRLQPLDFDGITDLCKKLNAAARVPPRPYVRSPKCPTCNRPLG